MKKTAANNKKPGALGSKDKKVLLVIAVVILAIIGFFGYRQFAIVQEKRHFEQAYEDIEKLRQEIAAELGEPTAVEQEKSCGYSSAKFSRGSLGCMVGAKIVYGVTDPEKATELKDQAYSLIDSSTYATPTSSSDDGFKGFGALSEDAYQYISYGLDTSYDLACQVGFYLTTRSHSPAQINSGEGAFVISFGCSNNESLAEHYPLTN